MGHFTMLFLMFIFGYSSANEDCNTNPALRCVDENFEVKFPENEEAVVNLCKSFKTKTECFLNVTEACEGNQNEIEQMRSVISFLTENCQESSRIYQVIISSLECIKPVFSSENDECKKSDDKKAAKFLTYLMELSERGIKEASDTESNMMKCLDFLYLDACLAAEVGKKCGSDARNSTVNIFQNLDINLKICKQEIIEDMYTLVNEFES